MGALVPTAVWRISEALVVALDERFGEPLDAYVNGSQVWLREDGPGEMTFEWRLHPVPHYQRPKGLETDAVFALTALALQRSEVPPRPVGQLWDGLECFAAYGDEIEPAVLASIATEVVGIAPDASGLADHERIADRWASSGRGTSIVADLLAELTGAT
jgi:hypothetical protein